MAGTAPYDHAYFERFRKQADTEIGRALMAARVEFVRDNWMGRDLVDVGIGSGAFLQRWIETGRKGRGYDVNPFGEEWLRKHNAWVDPYQEQVDAITLWDVFEHLPDPRPLLANVREMVFMALPIFKGPQHVLVSKHYRKDEHYWYFTAEGLERLMRDLGWALVAESNAETRIGREDIMSFAFQRIT